MKHLFAFALPESGLKPLAPEDIRRSKTDNDYLLTDRAEIEADGPALRAGDDALAALKAKGAEMGATLKAEDTGSLFMTWRSPTVGFPNGAYAYLVDGKVSFYGRALYGRRDFGANKAFIRDWASALK